MGGISTHWTVTLSLLAILAVLWWARIVAPTVTVARPIDVPLVLVVALVSGALTGALGVGLGVGVVRLVLG